MSAVSVVVVACSATTTRSSSPTQASSGTVVASSATPTTQLPNRWTIAANAAVSSPDGSAGPFDLQLESPVELSDLSKPTRLSMRATASKPGLAVFRAEVFTARLLSLGTLDVVGPGCPENYSFAELPTCSADPAIVPIGVTYADLGASKPTGSVFPSTAIPLLLITDALHSGTYHLDEDGVWYPADQQQASRQIHVGIDFTVASSANSNSTVTASTCFDKFMNEYQPDQVVPVVPADAQIVSVWLSPWPEGPQTQLSISDVTPVLHNAFTRIVGLIPNPLPTASQQTCCNGAVVVLLYTNDANAVYGPCELPDPLKDIPTAIDQALRAANP